MTCTCPPPGGGCFLDGDGCPDEEACLLAYLDEMEAARLADLEGGPMTTATREMAPTAWLQRRLAPEQQDTADA